MRVLVSSSSEELSPYEAAARDVVRELGWRALSATAEAAGASVDDRCRSVDAADLFLAIVGWRLRAVPDVGEGGDGRHSMLEWEVHHAFEGAKPVLVLMADDSWPPELRESDPTRRAWLADFRGELARLAAFFEPEATAGDPSPALPQFRARVLQLLRHPPRPAAGREELRLRRWPAPELPDRPYPLLLPYSHPALLGGRERELGELVDALERPIPILGMYAASGAGKSSLLLGALVPRARAAGRPVAYERFAQEAGLAGRLVGDLVEGGPEVDDDGDPQRFVEFLIAAGRAAGHPPWLVLDQFEEVLARPEARARAGALLAASVCRQPGCEGPPCRWLLAYRKELHGAVFRWLGDVLREARAAGRSDVELLPHDLATSERFHAWPLPLLGASESGATASGGADAAFLSAITAPLALRDAEGEPHYPYHFANDGAGRLARAFAEARRAHPGSPLVPELQVVLAHLLAHADALVATGGEAGESVEVPVPEDLGGVIDRALEEHLRRALDTAFPPTRDATSRRGRTRALLALRELADAAGRRDEGLPATVLAHAIGPAGSEVLERLATPQTRLVVLEETPEGFNYVLSHDRMAEIVVAAVEHEESAARLAVDRDLLDLRRFVALNTELYRAGESEQATRLSRRRFHTIAAHAEALLWDEDRRRWWAACRERFHETRRRAALAWAGAVAVLALVAVAATFWASRRASLEALYEQIEVGEPRAAFAAIERLTTEGTDDLEEVRARLRARMQPLDVLERGVGGVEAARRGPGVIEVAVIALPLIEEAPEDPVRLASLVWALDAFAGRDDLLAGRAHELRAAALLPLRRRRPPPPPAAGDAEWIAVAGGDFLMGSDADDEEAQDDEHPRCPVTVSPFRMLRHEVTNAEYRRLVPDHPGADELPVVEVSWHEAYAYAAWLGGRLPTEAEWEYAARGGCAAAFCDRHGRPTALATVGWYRGKASDDDGGDGAPAAMTLHPVMRLEPSPWGFFDLHGNAREWTADWYGPYSIVPKRDPMGPTDGSFRVTRGGSFWHPPQQARATHRETWLPLERARNIGLRVVLPPLPEPPPAPVP